MMQLVDNLRSANFGSPNHRARVYIIGVHDDLVGDDKFHAMCDWIEKSCPECHDVSSLSECGLPLPKESSGSLCSVWLGRLLAVEIFLSFHVQQKSSWCQIRPL